MQRLAVALLAILVLAITGNWQYPQASVYKQLKDWSVFCSNGLECTMTNYRQSDANSQISSLGLRRGTAANASLDLVLMTNNPLVAGSNITLKITGAKSGQVDTITLPVALADLQNNEWVISTDNHLTKILAALKSGSSVSLSAQTVTAGKTTPASADFSLSGVIASMLLIDETQGRLGRRDALHAGGDKPARAVETRARDLNTQDELPTDVRRAWAGGIDECSDEEEDIIARYGGLQVDIDQQSSLFLLPCNFPGAYNMPYVAIHFDVERKISRNVSFPIIGPGGPTNMATAYNINWNDKKSELDAFFRGRGIGDCGSKNLWRWNSDNIYSEFELLEARVKGDCDGKNDEFPQIWPPD